MNLLLIGVDLVFHVSLITEKRVQVLALPVVLDLDMHVQSLNVFRLRVRAMLVQSQIVVSQLTFIESDILD